MDIKQMAIISPYNIKWLVFIIETQCVYCALRAGYLTIINIQQFHVLPIQCFMCFLRISEQIAIISLYNINWIVL
jgi:prepilin signal peptidase PulO-like enzyme (type II secretory pathway)